MRVVGDDDEPLSDGRIGHVHIAGANVARGYYRNPEADAKAITRDGWLRTGNLGFIHDGELHVSGRANEIMIVDGMNFHPHDLEAIVHRSGAVEPGRVVAAGVRPPRAHTDRLVMFVIHRGSLREFLPVAEHVARVVGEGAAVHVGDVVPVGASPRRRAARSSAIVSRCGTRPANSFRTSRGSALFARPRAKANPAHGPGLRQR